MPHWAVPPKSPSKNLRPHGELTYNIELKLETDI
jgi:hypothetical protein